MVPTETTEATAELEEDHVTAGLEALLGVVVVVNSHSPETGSVTIASCDSVMLATGMITVTVALPFTPFPEAAVTTATPGASAVTTPAVDMVATVCGVMLHERIWTVAPDGAMSADMGNVAPTASCCVNGVTVTAVTGCGGPVTVTTVVPVVPLPSVAVAVMVAVPALFAV